MNPGDKITALIRTWTPMVVGYGCSFLLLHFGFKVSAADQEWATSTLGTGVSALYYWGALQLSQKWPQLGWLLGHPAKPTYTTPAPAPAPPAP